MATLTQISVTTRKSIRYAVFGIIFLIFARIIFTTSFKIYRYFFPAPPPPPTVSFGKLSPIPFPVSKKVDGVSFSLETPDGALPTFKTQAAVYVMPKPAPGLSSLEKATANASKLGFLPSPEQISQTLYRFKHKTTPSTLEYNISTSTFSISYDLAKDASPLERIPPAAEVAASSVRSYLSGADVLPEDLIGPTTHQFLKITEGKLVKALGQSDADLIKINLYREQLNDLPSVTSRFNEANVWFMVSGSRERSRQFIAAEYHYFPIDETQSSTYPIKTSEKAWEELKNQDAFVVTKPTSQNIIIRRVYLAHYDPGLPFGFYQPVIVFEGDENFVAYVPAVTEEYYGE